MPDEFQPAVDEYLVAVVQLSAAAGEAPVVPARLAERLGKSRPAVGEMLERLVGGGFIRRILGAAEGGRSGRAVVLTEAGRERAEGAIRRRRLAECLLSQVLGMEWRDVHAEAARIESVISEEVADRIAQLLGNPATCPHGNAIPGTAGTGTEGAGMALSESAAGDTVRLLRLGEALETDGEAIGYLDAGGFLPGVEAAVGERAPDGTLVLSIGCNDLAVGPWLSARLFVVRL